MEMPREHKRKKSSKDSAKDDRGDESKTESRTRRGTGSEARTRADSVESAESRRMDRRIRRAKKMARHLEELGLDEDGNELDNFSLAKYPVRECKFSIPGMSNQDQVAVNPVVTFIAVVFLWGIVMWCASDTTTALAKLDEWRTSISLHFTWLFSGTKALYVFFALFVLYKFGSIKLGGKDDKPEFSTLTYAVMIFAVNATNAILMYSASEPLTHQSYHYYAQASYRSQDELDMFAINLTVTDWGLGGWAPGALVAVAMSLAAYRFGLPMTYRSCFFPILGAYTWGWIGDVIDGFTIVATLANVCSSLGLAATSMVAGLAHMEWTESDITQDQASLIQNSFIWVVTVVSLISVLSGLHGGIKLLCIAAVGVGTMLMLVVFAVDDTKYLLNLQVQEVGSYLQSSIFQLNFWTDAFGQLRDGSGRAVDGKAAEPWWFQAWFNFTQSWWVAAAAISGQFICSISRGRKVWEVILYSLFVPVAYLLVWFCVWGGIALRQQRQALEMEALGVTWFNNSAHFMTDANEWCYDVPQTDILVDGMVVFTNYLPGVTPVCKFDEEHSDTAIFNIFKSFGKEGLLGPILSFFFLLASVLFYMTNTGASSLMVDKMASSGRKNNHLARRMFWLVTAGALTTALLSKGGGADAVVAIQGAMIVIGLPSAVLLCFVLQSLLSMCRQATNQEESDYEFPNQPEFAVPIYGGVFNVFEYCVSLGKVNQARRDRGMGNATSAQVTEFAKGLVVPFVSMWQILQATHPQSRRNNTALVAGYAVLYVTWMSLCVASWRWSGLTGLCWTLCIIHGSVLATMRSSFRSQHNDIRSHAAADLVASTLLWPQVWCQMNLYCREVAAGVIVVPSTPKASMSIAGSKKRAPTTKACDDVEA